MNIIVLDDEREFNIPDAIHCKTVDQLMDALETIPSACDELYLDHDLGYKDSDKEIREFCRMLVETFMCGCAPEIKRIYVHSMNVVGAQWIVDCLSKYYDVKRIPLPPLNNG